jgi:hypothetical protein
LREFKEIARPHGVVVVDKWDLIDESDKEFLEVSLPPFRSCLYAFSPLFRVSLSLLLITNFLQGLEFDQLGILDFVVLTHAEVFWGFGGR